jgi:DNA-binding NarL/FixJ family response regulator
MPGLNGAQATEAVLRASPESRVVCLTASVSRKEVAQLEAAGAVACISKDGDLDAIVAAIHDAAGRTANA